MNQRHQRGFTLIELLVVIAIIAILAAILFPVFSKAREKARQAKCISNQKQVTLAITIYTQENDEALPGSAWTSETGLTGKVLDCPNTSNSGSAAAPDYLYFAGPTAGKLLNGRKLGEFADATIIPVCTDYLSAGSGDAFINKAGIIDIAADILPKIAMRHNGNVIMGFLDGHVAMLKGSEVTEGLFAGLLGPADLPAGDGLTLISDTTSTSGYGAPFTLTLSVDAGVTGVTSVTFYDNSLAPALQMGTATVTGGNATLNFRARKAGAYEIQAVSNNARTSNVIMVGTTITEHPITGWTAAPGTNPSMLQISGGQIVSLSPDGSEVFGIANEQTPAGDFALVYQWYASTNKATGCGWGTSYDTFPTCKWKMWESDDHAWAWGGANGNYSEGPNGSGNVGNIANLATYTAAGAYFGVERLGVNLNYLVDGISVYPVPPQTMLNPPAGAQPIRVNIWSLGGGVKNAKLLY